MVGHMNFASDELQKKNVDIYYGFSTAHHKNDNHHQWYVLIEFFVGASSNKRTVRGSVLLFNG